MNFQEHLKWLRAEQKRLQEAITALEGLTSRNSTQPKQGRPRKKPHWTQTARGRAFMKRRARKRFRAKK